VWVDGQLDSVPMLNFTLAERTVVVTDGTMQKPATSKRRHPNGARSLPTCFLTLAVALGGCSTDMFGSRPTATTGSTPASMPGFGDKVSDFFRGQPEKTAADASPQADAAIDCPRVDVRQGAGTYTLNNPGGDQSALALRMQATFGQTARECHVSAGMLTIKVGVQGRVILGPAGTPGDVTVPLRYALVQEGVEPKTLWTKFYQVPVTVPPDVTNVPFTHVQQEMIVPLPKPGELDAYVIYVGFDPAGLPDAAKKPKSKPQPKSKARTSSAASGQLSTR
jgi:hypothetical protein